DREVAGRLARDLGLDRGELAALRLELLEQQSDARRGAAIEAHVRVLGPALAVLLDQVRAQTLAQSARVHAALRGLHAPAPRALDARLLGSAALDEARLVRHGASARILARGARPTKFSRARVSAARPRARCRSSSVRARRGRARAGCADRSSRASPA